MPEEWLPGATRMPGAAAGWAKGRTPVRTVVCHYTVGRDSTNIGLQGYFHWLIRRNGEAVQFCETSALAWHAGNEGNPVGPGIEVEYLASADDTVFTPEALKTTGELVRWLNAEWGVPLDYFDPQVRMALPLPAGFVAHRSLPNQDHTDFWPRDDWDRMVSGASSTTNLEYDMTICWGRTVFGISLAFLVSGGRVLRVFQGPEGAYGINQAALDWKAVAGRDAVPLVLVDPDIIGQFATPWPAASGGSAGTVPTTVATKADVAASQNAVIAEVRKPRTLT